MIGHNLTGAEARIERPTSKIKKAGESWQDELWSIYENLGAVHYGLGLKRHAAERISYFVAEQPDDVDEPIPTEDPRANEALDRLGDVSEIVGEFVVHTNVAGEGFLVGRVDADGEEDWEVWSAAELNAARVPGREQLTDDDFVLRVWRPSPYQGNKPDSSLRSVQQQCEQLLLLNDQIGAVAMSRLSAGILLVPSELSFESYATEPPDTGANAARDPFMAEIIEIAVNPITDSQSAARVAPAVIRGASEYLGQISHLTFARDIDKTFADMRNELLRAIAGGIDMPAEIITGLADLNHWSLWGIDESTAKLHVDPDVLMILSGLTEGYLWQTLEESGMARDQAREFLIWRDYSDLTSRPISIDQAIDLRKLGTISDEYLRRIANIPEDGAGDGVPIATGTNPAPEDNREPPALAAADTSIYLSEFGEIDRALATRIIEATEAAFGRALERAGLRIRNKAGRQHRDITAQLQGIANIDVPRHLGWRRTEQLQLTMDQLLPGDEFDQLKARLDSLLANAQAETRTALEELLDTQLAELDEAEDRSLAIAAFIASLFTIASERLFTPQPDPDPAETGEFLEGIAPGQLVYQMMTTAGGGGTVAEFTPETPRGLALGQRTRSTLKDHGYLIASETWIYGDPSARRTNFEPHRALAGKIYVPTPPPFGAGWLGVQFMFPGDHRGCLCTLVPTVLPTASPLEEVA